MLRVVVVGAVGAALVAAAGARSSMFPPGERPGGRWRSPEIALAVLVGIAYLNQVLFTIYVLREHGGDPSFADQYVPDGWFTLADSSAIEGLSRHFPAPGLLAPSAFRVNAFLELPMVVLAYLTVCRWFSTAAYQRALRLVAPTAVIYTMMFCLIEWRLYNPYTVDDVALRVVAAVAVMALLPRWLTRNSPTRTDNIAGLLVFGASALGFALLVLAVYDTALLYNLGHLDAQAPVAVLGTAVLVAGRFLARRVDATAWPELRTSAGTRFGARPGTGAGTGDGHDAGGRSPGPCTDVLVQGAGWLLVVAMVPALPIRYGLTFGAPYVAALGTLVVAATAGGLALRDVLRVRPGVAVRLGWQLVATAAVGLGAGVTTLFLVDLHRTEARLLVGAVAALVGALASAASFDRRTALRQGSYEWRDVSSRWSGSP